MSPLQEVIMACPQCQKPIGIQLAKFNGAIFIECQCCGKKIVLKGGYAPMETNRMKMLCTIGG